MSRLSLLVIKCSNLDRSKVFYEALGVTFAKEKHGKGPEHWASTNLPDSVLELYPSRDNKITQNLTFGLSVGDVDSAYKVLQERGFHPRHEPRDDGWGRHFMVEDPNGLLVDIVDS
jgi:catechol 2,3-dioxygenase-like lactoylglutathione lyase family enzyme